MLCGTRGISPLNVACSSIFSAHRRHTAPPRLPPCPFCAWRLAPRSVFKPNSYCGEQKIANRASLQSPRFSVTEPGPMLPRMMRTLSTSCRSAMRRTSRPSSSRTRKMGSKLQVCACWTDYATALAVHDSWVRRSPGAPAQQKVPWKLLAATDQVKDIHFASEVRAWLLEHLDLISEDHSSNDKADIMEAGGLFTHIDLDNGWLPEHMSEDDRTSRGSDGAHHTQRLLRQLSYFKVAVITARCSRKTH